MSESSDYDPGQWKGQSFQNARQDYVKAMGRSYEDAKSTGKKLEDVRAASVETQCSSPLIVVGDETGSMGEWLVPIFSKLGYLANEAPTYLGEDLEISFCAVGDAFCGEKYPLQPRPFASGLALKDRLKELVMENGGGGNGGESYELAALYYARNCSTPKAIRKPIIIFIGDEQPHDPVKPAMAEEVAGVKIERSMSAKQVFDELKQKFAVYMVLKPYNVRGGDSDYTNKGIYDIWVKLLGFENVKPLTEADRVVDVIFGILAEVTDKNEAFREDMEKRQTAAQRNTVYKSLGLNEDGTPKVKSGKKAEDKKPATGKIGGAGGKSVLRSPKKEKPGKLY